MDRPRRQAQAGGQDLYVGLYFWNSGSPELMLFLRDNGNWSELGLPYPVSPLAAGTTLTLTAVGSTISFSDNGTVALTANDPTLSGGAPGIIAYGTPTAGNWAGGDAVGGGHHDHHHRPVYDDHHPVFDHHGPVFDHHDPVFDHDHRRRHHYHHRGRQHYDDRPVYHDDNCRWHEREPLGQFRQGEREPRPELDRHDHRRADHRQPSGGGDQCRRVLG